MVRRNTLLLVSRALAFIQLTRSLDMTYLPES
jgi:hypothetical protein